ncbi:MAG: hypothetical protein Q8R79_03620 [Legionellaceae bacterium]|nr:hypothetical protein [Legionellaceae bacterium]
MSLTLQEIQTLLAADKPGNNIDQLAKIIDALIALCTPYAQLQANIKQLTKIKSNLKYSATSESIADINLHIQALQKTTVQFANHITLLLQDMKSANASDLFSQSAFIDRAKALGYQFTDPISDHKNASEGMCYGITHMGMQAFLAEDISTFQQRARSIHLLPLDYFKNDFAILRDAQRQFILEKKSEQAKQISQLIVDCLAFFDGCMLYQLPAKYNDWFQKNNSVKRRQHALESMPLTLSKQLEIPQKKPVRVSFFTGIYSQSELEKYLSVLEKTLKDTSFALCLSSTKHAVNLNYNHSTKRWLLIDPNRLPGQEFTDHAPLAKKLLSCIPLEEGNIVRENFIMASSIYTLAEHAQNTRGLLSTLEKNPAWQALHPPEKINYTDDYGSTQLGKAIAEGDYDAVERALVAGANISQEHQKTPALHWVSLHHDKKITQLIEQSQIFEELYAEVREYQAYLIQKYSLTEKNINTLATLSKEALNKRPLAEQKFKATIDLLNTKQNTSFKSRIGDLEKVLKKHRKTLSQYQDSKGFFNTILKIFEIVAINLGLFKTEGQALTQNLDTHAKFFKSNKPRSSHPFTIKYIPKT